MIYIVCLLPQPIIVFPTDYAYDISDLNCPIIDLQEGLDRMFEQKAYAVDAMVAAEELYEEMVQLFLQPEEQWLKRTPATKINNGVHGERLEQVFKT